MPTIDADAHVVESERTWDYMDAADQKYRPIVVKPSGDQGGEYWFIDGKIRGLVRIVMTAHELDKVADRTGRVMFTPQETREMENVDARVKHMDELGIDIQVLYPTILSSRSPRSPSGRSPFARATTAGSRTSTSKGRAGCGGSACCRFSTWTRHWRSCSSASRTAPAGSSCAASRGAGC